MGVIPVLILWPALIALLIPFLKQSKVRGIAVYVGAGGVMILALTLLISWLSGGQTVNLYQQTELIDHLMLAGELVLMVLIVYLSIKHRKYPVILLSVGQTGLLL